MINSKKVRIKMHKIPIYIINLKKDTEKKDHMQELCNKNSLECQFIDAVYGRDLSKNYIEQINDKNKSIREYGKELTSGEIGCTLSHIAIYKQMIEQDIENAIIFEDDIDIKEGFSSVINSTDNFPQDWEVMLLGYYSQVSNEKETKASLRYNNKVTGNFKSVRLVQLAYGTHGYMINRKGAEKLLKELTLIIKPIDHYTGIDTYVNMYAIHPRVVMLNEKFKEQSSITLERNESQNKRIHEKEMPMTKKILKKTGLLNIIMKIKMNYNRFKKLKEYK